MIDIDELTLGEVAMVEKLSEQSITAMADESAPKALLMAAMAYVINKRENPKYTFEEAKQLKLADLDGLLG